MSWCQPVRMLSPFRWCVRWDTALISRGQRETTMIRPTTPEETPVLVEIATGTKVFKPHELLTLQEVLDEYHEANQGFGHRAVTYEKDGRPIGFAYYAPTAMTDQTW